MKIRYINPEPPDTYRYYTDLERALGKMGVLMEDCFDDADVAVYGPAWFRSKENVVEFYDDRIPPQICFVHKMEVDWEMKKMFANQCDLVISPLPKLPIKHKLFPYGVDPNIFNDKGLERVFDFGFTGALHSEPDRDQSAFPIPHFRRKIQDLARTQKDLSLYLTGSDDVNKCRIMDYEKYAETLSQAKIWLASTGPHGDIGPRYYEIQASKTLLFCDPPPEEYRRHFRDGANCVYITSETFIEKLRYYLANEDKRNRIVNKAFNECITNHTWTSRAWELIGICNATLQKV
jgi:hypothetical protein